MLEPLVRNWPIKLLALLLAFAIWIGVTGENRIVQDFRVPLDLTLPEHLIPGEPPPSTVNVRLRGPETLFRRLDPLPLEINVDLREAGPGPRTVLLTPDQIAGLPSGVEVGQIEPDRFRPARAPRSRPPGRPRVPGQPPAGFAVYDVRVSRKPSKSRGPSRASR